MILKFLFELKVRPNMSILVSFASIGKRLSLYDTEFSAIHSALFINGILIIVLV
jgi:hypothetical protein